MKIDQLLSFMRVADERSYTKAAEKAYLTQPAIYSQVRQLETECGAKVFSTVAVVVSATTDCCHGHEANAYSTARRQEVSARD